MSVEQPPERGEQRVDPPRLGTTVSTACMPELASGGHRSARTIAASRRSPRRSCPQPRLSLRGPGRGPRRAPRSTGSMSPIAGPSCRVGVGCFRRRRLGVLFSSVSSDRIPFLARTTRSRSGSTIAVDYVRHLASAARRRTGRPRLDGRGVAGTARSGRGTRSKILMGPFTGQAAPENRQAALSWTLETTRPGCEVCLEYCSSPSRRDSGLVSGDPVTAGDADVETGRRPCRRWISWGRRTRPGRFSGLSMEGVVSRRSYEPAHVVRGVEESSVAFSSDPLGSTR